MSRRGAWRRSNAYRSVRRQLPAGHPAWQGSEAYTNRWNVQTLCRQLDGELVQLLSSQLRREGLQGRPRGLLLSRLQGMRHGGQSYEHHVLLCVRPLHSLLQEGCH